MCDRIVFYSFLFWWVLICVSFCLVVKKREWKSKVSLYYFPLDIFLFWFCTWCYNWLTISKTLSIVFTGIQINLKKFRSMSNDCLSTSFVFKLTEVIKAFHFNDERKWQILCDPSFSFKQFSYSSFFSANNLLISIFFYNVF